MSNIEIIYEKGVLYILASEILLDNVYIINQTNFEIEKKSILENQFSKIYYYWDIVKPIYGDWYLWTYAIEETNILNSLAQKEENMINLRYFHKEILKKIIEFNFKFSFQTFSYKPYFIIFNFTEERKKEIEAFSFGKKLLKEFSEIECKMKFDDFYNLYYQNYKKEIESLLEKGLLSFQIFDEKERDFFDLSYGERMIFLTNMILFDSITQRNTNLIIYLDEIDIGLHPNWQKRYINDFIKVFSQLEIKLHFIFTTHSPFLLSDIPKQNIIFLDTYKGDEPEVLNGEQKVGNCKVVDGLKEKKQTFGANIHTLLSDSFFMEDGLMGEFAKEKIENVIKFLKDEESIIKNKEEAKKIIDIIGESFIRDKLLYMYKEKFPISKEDKIKELEEELRRLKGD